MRSSKAIIGTARRLILAVVFAFPVPAAFAQTPPASNRDDLDVTMRTIGNPDANVPDEIVRKIPPPKAKKRGQGADDRADDLALAGESGEDEGGSAVDPETPVVPDAPDDTGTPIDPGPGAPDEGGPGSAPDPREHTGNLGHDVAEDGQHHGQDAHQNGNGPNAPGQDHTPSGPKSEPRGPKHSDPKPPNPKHPDPKTPGPKDTWSKRSRAKGPRT